MHILSLSVFGDTSLAAVRVFSVSGLACNGFARLDSSLLFFFLQNCTKIMSEFFKPCHKFLDLDSDSVTPGP